MRILLIEDEEVLASVLLKSLTKQHYVVDVAQDGQMGWEYTQNASYDLLLIDVGLPKLDGITLCQRLRSGGCFTPILLMTAKDGTQERIQGLDAGADDYLIKPLDLGELQARIRALLRRGDRPVTPILEVGALRLDPSSCEVTYNNTLLELTTPDLLILDVDMPQISRVELCQAVRTDPQWQELPIVFLTAHREIKIIQQVFAVGGDDYVIKPVVGAELLARITHRLERSRLLQSLSTKDPLTGIANQFQSRRNLEHLITQAEKNQQSVCLAILSVNDLRQINIKYGHEAGNQVLQRWSRLFQSAFCNGEMLGYWGNGDFVVEISGVTKAEINHRLSEILTTLRQQIFTAFDGDLSRLLP